MSLKYSIGMKKLAKEEARLGMWVSARGEIGVVDAITRSVVAVRCDDGKYVLAKWEEDCVYEA